MLHVRLCTVQRSKIDEPFGFELWRSRRKSASTAEQESNAELLIIKSVQAESAAAKGDLREGDKIIALDGINVRDTQSIRDLLAKALEVRIMVERWEGPNVKPNERKTSIQNKTVSLN